MSKDTDIYVNNKIKILDLMDSKIGGYQILKELTPNSVFLVEDVTGDKKLLRQYELASSWTLNLFDVKTLMTLQHKNLLPPSDVFTKENYKYAVYEYNDFVNNLENYLKSKGKLTKEELSTISKQIINAYQYIKDKGLIHGNINPTSIIVDEKDGLTIKLTDFLLCLDVKKDLWSEKFMAPEIVSKCNNPNIISDVYSIGAIIKILLECTESSIETCSKLIQDCLQINPNKRIQFDILTLHPYFTSINPPYKYFRGNLLNSIRLSLYL